MVSKDQAIGGAICLVCVIIGILYTLGLFLYGYFWAPSGLTWPLALTLVAIPVFIVFIAILAIGAWIGWTMATTPPPKPIEEITGEMEKEQKATTAEEKTTTEEKPSEPQKMEEEKKPDKKRKT